MKNAVKLATNEKDREHNVIMFNVEEQPDDDTSENYGADVLALEIMISAGLDLSEREFSSERVRSSNKEKNRPLKVKFNCMSVVFHLLTKSKTLKDDEQYNHDVPT